MVRLEISLRVRRRSIASANTRRKRGPEVDVQAETETETGGLGLRIGRTVSNAETQVPRVRCEESSAVIPVSATASAAASSASAVSFISSQASSAAAAAAASSSGAPSGASITACQAQNSTMSFSKSNSHSSSSWLFSCSAAALPPSAGATILILSTASSDQAAFIAAACADNGPLGNGEVGSGAANAMKTFGVQVGGDNGGHSSLDEGRTAVDLGIVLRFRSVGGQPVCFITTPELDGGLESVPRLGRWLGDVLAKQNTGLTGIIFLHSATETLEPAVMDALEVIVRGTEMQQVMFVSSGWEDLNAREFKEAELQQQLVNATLCAKMNVQTLTWWRYDGSASSAEAVVHQVLVNDDAIRAMDRVPDRVFLLPGARAAGTKWLSPWLKWLPFAILTFAFVMTAVGYMKAASAMRQLGQEFTHVGQEVTRMVGLLATDPQAAGVVLKEVLNGVLSGEEHVHVAEEVTRMVGLMGDDPKTAGVVLKEVLSGALSVEHWPSAREVNLWTKNEVVNGVMRQTDSVKMSDGIEGVARVIMVLLSSLGNDRETVARTLAGWLEKLGDDREALADRATEIMYGALGDSPESAVVFWKEFWHGIFAGDAKPGFAWLDGAGDGQGRRPNWGMEVPPDLADTRSKSGAKMEQLEEAISRVGGQGSQESLAQQKEESAKGSKELRTSPVRDDRDAAAWDVHWTSGGWGQVILALVIGLVVVMFLNRRAEGV